MCSVKTAVAEAATSGLHPEPEPEPVLPNPHIRYEPEDDIYYFIEKPSDPCQEHLKHKRPTVFEFLGVRPSFVNPYVLAEGKLLITPKLQASLFRSHVDRKR